jgi:hypothetical protein
MQTQFLSWANKILATVAITSLLGLLYKYLFIEEPMSKSSPWPHLAAGVLVATLILKLFSKK